MRRYWYGCGRGSHVKQQQRMLSVRHAARCVLVSQGERVRALGFITALNQRDTWRRSLTTRHNQRSLSHALRSCARTAYAISSRAHANDAAREAGAGVAGGLAGLALGADLARVAFAEVVRLHTRPHGLERACRRECLGVHWKQRTLCSGPGSACESGGYDAPAHGTRPHGR